MIWSVCSARAEIFMDILVWNNYKYRLFCLICANICVIMYIQILCNNQLIGGADEVIIYYESLKCELLCWLYVQWIELQIPEMFITHKLCSIFHLSTQNLSVESVIVYIFGDIISSVPIFLWPMMINQMSAIFYGNIYMYTCTRYL